MAKNAVKKTGASAPSAKIRALIAAAERGAAEAALDLGDRYREGQGVGKDCRHVRDW